MVPKGEIEPPTREFPVPATMCLFNELDGSPLSAVASAGMTHENLLFITFVLAFFVNFVLTIFYFSLSLLVMFLKKPASLASAPAH